MLEALDKMALPRILPNSSTVGNFSLGRSLAAIQRVMNSDVLVTLSTFLNPDTNRTILLVSTYVLIDSIYHTMSRWRNGI